MKINPIQPNYNNYNSQKKQSFKGYDARPVKALVCRSTHSPKLTKQISDIFAKHDIQLFQQWKYYIKNLTIRPDLETYLSAIKTYDAHDFFTIANNKLYALAEDINHMYDRLAKLLGIELNTVQKSLAPNYIERTDMPDEKKRELNNKHIISSNLFIVKDGDDEIALVGEREAQKLFDLDYYGRTLPSFRERQFELDELQEVLGVKKIIPLPQRGGNLDQFIRPLDNKRILLADEQMSFDIIKQLEERYDEFEKSYDHSQNNENKISEGMSGLHILMRRSRFEEIKKGYNIAKQYREYYNQKDFDYVEKKLTENGFEVIRVPGRISGLMLNEKGLEDVYTLENPVSSIAVKDKNEELIYVASTFIDEYLFLTPELIKKIGYSFEKELRNVFHKFIKQENLHLLKPEESFFLRLRDGSFKGLHRDFLEVPDNGISVEKDFEWHCADDPYHLGILDHEYPRDKDGNIITLIKNRFF